MLSFWFQLDAKKSPLALLAQTCSQIGADTPSNKSLLVSLDKSSSNKSSKSADQSREKSSPAVAAASTEPAKTNFKPYESCLSREKTSSPDEQRSASSHSTSGRSRTPGSNNKRCPSNQSASSVRAVTPQGRKTATPNGDIARESPGSRTSAANSSAQIETSGSSQPAVSSPSLQTRPSYSPAGVLAMTDPSIRDLPLGTFKPGVSLASSTSAYLGYSSQLPVDVMASSLMSQHHAALKNGLVAGNPYLSYARLKTASGSDALMPVCRDPYCTGCQLNYHLLPNATNGKLASGAAPGSCPAGCAQCDRSQTRGTLRCTRCRRVRSRTVGCSGGGVAASLCLQLDCRRHRLLRQKVLHVGRVAAAPKKPHERVDKRNRGCSRALDVVTLRWLATDASLVLEDLPHTTSESARNCALSPLRETVIVAATVLIFAGVAASSASPS